VQNPLAWVLALMALALAAFKREQQHGWMLDRIENDAGETARKDKQPGRRSASTCKRVTSISAKWTK